MKSIPYDPAAAEIAKLRQQNEELKALIMREAEKERALSHKVMKRGSEWRRRGR